MSQIQSIQNLNYSLKGTVLALQARNLVREIKNYGYGRGYGRYHDQLVLKYGNHQECYFKICQILEVAVKEGYLVWKNGRFHLTQKSNGIF